MKPLIRGLVYSAVISLSYGAAIGQGNRQVETVAVRGVVVDEAGAPVSGADVSVRYLSQTMAKVRSAADGSFTIDVPRRSFDGVLLLASDERGDRLGTLIHPDQGRGTNEPVKMVLRKAAKVEVRVTDAQGAFVTGARVAASYHQQPLAEEMTDEAGLAMLRVPAGVKLLVYAVAREAGLDYARPTFDSDDQVSLALRGMVNVRVKVVDQREQPISGAKVYPMFVARMHEPMMSFSVGNMPEFVETTDKSGIAICRIPIDNIYHVPIQVEKEGYVRPPWVYWIPDEKVTGVRTGMGVGNARTVWGDEFTADLKPSVIVRGTIVHPDGSPAAGANIGAFGHGYNKTGYVQGGTSEADGSFQLALAPDMYYVFNAEAGGECSRDQKRVIVAGRAVEPLKLVLQQPRRIHGTLTGSDGAPIPNQHLSLIWSDDESYAKLPAEEQLPNSKDDPSPIVLSIWTNGRTDEKGRFEFLVAPARYYVVAPDKMNLAHSASGVAPELPVVNATDQAEVKIDLH
jgi:hypothetical protein